MKTTTSLSQKSSKIEWDKFLKKEFASVHVPMSVSNERMESLLISAFEGGINYWVSEEQFPGNDTHIDFIEKVLQAKDDSYYCLIVLDEPLTPKIIRSHENCFKLKLQISADDTSVPSDKNIHKVKLCRSVILSGLKRLAEKRPDRMQRVLEEQDDAEDADVFFQYCVFGDTIYG